MKSNKLYSKPRVRLLNIEAESNLMQASRWPGGPEMPDDIVMPDDEKKSYTDFN